MHDEQPAVVAGIYTQPYNELVRPERVWKISKYFLRRWTPYLSPSEVWLVIGARQLSYFNERRPWFRAYDRTLAEAAGLHVKVFRRTIKKAICDGAGPIGAFLRKTADPHYRREDGVTRQTQTRYTIRLDDPLTPGDAAALAYWLRRNSPQQVNPASIRALLESGAELQARALQAEDVAQAPEVEAPDLLAVADVVRHVFPSLAGAGAASAGGSVIGAGRADGGWREAADTLHSHIVTPELAHFETQYFRRRWLPLLGPGPALLLSYLRSLCYHNEDSGEIRDRIALQSGQLEDVFQISSRTLRRWFARVEEFANEDNPAGRFVETLESVKQSNQKVLTTYRVALRTPLTVEDLQTYRQKLAANGQKLAANGQEVGQVADGKFPTDLEGGGHKVPHTNKGDGQKVPHTDGGNGQKGAHDDTGERQKVAHTSAGGGQKVPDGNGGGGQNVAGWATEEGSYKYYKILRETVGLNSIEDLQAKVPQQEQQFWQWADGRARASFAAVVGGDSLVAFLDRIGVQEPARTEVLAQHVGLAEAVGWTLYALQQENLDRPVSYVISRLCRGDPPPLDYVQLASLSWEQWRVYAWAWQARPWLGKGFERFAQLPLFEQWAAAYGGLHADDLPFDVGLGLARLAGRLANAAHGERAKGKSEAHAGGPPAAELALWRAALEELSLQMTRATFDAWLREARLVACQGGEYVVAVAGPEAQAWLENRLQEMVERTVRGVTEGRVRRVRFVLGSAAGARDSAAADSGTAFEE